MTGAGAGEVSEQLYSLVDRMLQVDPSKRPSAADVHALASQAAAEFEGPEGEA